MLLVSVLMNVDANEFSAGMVKLNFVEYVDALRLVRLMNIDLTIRVEYILATAVSLVLEHTERRSRFHS
jgi:hypothetical protein